MTRLYHQDNFATNITSNQVAGVTTTPLNSIPSVSAPFRIALDSLNTNGKYEVVTVTSKTATHILHAATAYEHTTAETVSLVVDADEMDEISAAINGEGPLAVMAPQGFLINGKISVTDTGSGLTVAVKTLAGTDASSTSPIYVRIGDTVRSITAALSVTKADGTNWCNAGSAELATKEIDYFVYLGYNATDGVVIGFSRIPGANSYDDFSATTTNEKYCAISTITNAASTDYYENVGRFAATLSAGAGYTWSVPTYTAKNLIQRPIYETRFLSATGVYSGNGSMTYGTTTTSIYDYKITNNYILVIHNHNGTVGGTLNTQIRFILPFSAIGNNLTENQSIVGNNQKGYVYRKIDSSTKNLCVDESPSGNYTAGSSFHFGTFSYKI